MTTLDQFDIEFDNEFEKFDIGCTPCTLYDNNQICGRDVKWFNKRHHIHVCDEHVDKVWQELLKKHRKLLKAWSPDVIYIAEYASVAVVTLTNGTSHTGKIRINHQKWLSIDSIGIERIIQRKNITTILGTFPEDES